MFFINLNFLRKESRLKLEKNYLKKNKFLAIKWQDVHDVSVLSTAHAHNTIEALISREAQEKPVFSDGL
jgi:hypothetical protein